MKKTLLFSLMFFVLFVLPIAAQESDVLVVTVELRDNQVKVIDVVQSPSFDQPVSAEGEYTLEVWRDGKKISERKFDLTLENMKIRPEDPNEPPYHATATQATKSLVMPLPQAGGTINQYTIKIFQGEKEIFSSTLDKISFRREAEVNDPIRSEEEVELLKQAQKQESAPVEPAKDGDFPWGLVIAGVVFILVALSGFLVYRYYKIKKYINGQDENQ